MGSALMDSALEVDAGFAAELQLGLVNTAAWGVVTAAWGLRACFAAELNLPWQQEAVGLLAGEMLAAAAARMRLWGFGEPC